jgi:light-regulated signal transduction histidine kinase (bacteriophytochrome)
MCEGLLAKATKLESQVSYPHVVFASQEPLRTVCLFSELLAKRNSSENNRNTDELIATIIENAKRIEQLVCGLLDFSRIDAQTGARFKLT